MLSLFPSLLSWSQLSPFIIRLTLAAVLIVWAYGSFRNSGAKSSDKVIALIESLVALFLIFGHWTQGAALVAILDLLVRIGFKIRARQFLTSGINYYLIILVLAVSLLFTGAGLFASDMPL